MARLTSIRVTRLLSKGEPGRHFDAKGLYLVIVSKTAAHWERRYMLRGREHYYGLGSAIDAFGLSAARKRNEAITRLLADGIDPLESKRAERAQKVAEAAGTMTFGEAAEKYFKANVSTWKHSRHVNQWRATILGKTLRGKAARQDPCRDLRPLPVQSITTPLVMSVLEPLWSEKPETASRIRARIAVVLDWAKAGGLRHGDNPADWKIIGKLLPLRGKVAKVKHLEAVPYREIPAFMCELRRHDSLAARALEFTVLTAARTGETLGATWGELDLDEQVWTVPPERMKAGREHRVMLAPQAVALLKALARKGDVVFPGPTKGGRISDAAMRDTMRQLGRTESVHGFRSSFSDWANERTAHSHHAIEISLAHKVGSEVEQAYRRGDMIEKRRRLMEQWAKYCCSPPVTMEQQETDDNVVRIRGSTPLAG
jgi:integrase